jgi:hypothetical protein
VLLAQSEASAEEIALIAAPLSIPTGEHYSLPQTSPQKSRHKPLAALFAQLLRLASPQSVLLVYEDVQWIDHTKPSNVSRHCRSDPDHREARISPTLAQKGACDNAHSEPVERSGRSDAGQSRH